jgi:hypothetical protein
MPEEPEKPVRRRRAPRAAAREAEQPEAEPAAEPDPVRERERADRLRQRLIRKFYG